MLEGLEILDSHIFYIDEHPHSRFTIDRMHEIFLRCHSFEIHENRLAFNDAVSEVLAHLLGFQQILFQIMGRGDEIKPCIECIDVTSYLSAQLFRFYFYLVAMLPYLS